MKRTSNSSIRIRSYAKNPAQSPGGVKSGNRGGHVGGSRAASSATAKTKVKAKAQALTQGPAKGNPRAKVKAAGAETGAGGRGQIRIALRPVARAGSGTVVAARAGAGAGRVSPEVVRAVAQALHQIEGTRAKAVANGGPRYNSGERYDSGVRFATDDPVPTPVQTGTGAKVKLALNDKNNATVIEFAKTHDLAIDGNVNFPSPLPTPTVFRAKLTELETVNSEYEEMRLGLKALSERRDRIRGEFNAVFTQRGTYVELQSGGNAELIQEVALPVKNPSVKLPQLAPPIGLRTDLNGTPGVMAVRWETVTGARAYLLESSPVLPEGGREWRLTKVGGSNAKLPDLVVGTRYAFRVAAVGGAEGRSPWSLEVERVAG